MLKMRAMVARSVEHRRAPRERGSRTCHARFSAHLDLMTAGTAPDPLDALARTMTLGALLERLHDAHGGYELIAHHTQGEFHHDVIVRVHDHAALPGEYVSVATNCNGGVKEVLAFRDEPTPDALWRMRCPDNADFGTGQVATPLGVVRTVHYFDPCELLREDARSELKPEFRQRQRGGGWEPRD